MNTIKQIIQRVDEMKPNAFSPQTKLEWIAELDGKIAVDVHLAHHVELTQPRYQYPEGLDLVPLVKFPHDALYDKWLIAQIDAANEEWQRYANNIEVFNSYYKDYVRWVASRFAGGRQ